MKESYQYWNNSSATVFNRTDCNRRTKIMDKVTLVGKIISLTTS